MAKPDMKLLRPVLIGLLLGSVAGAGLGFDALARIEPGAETGESAARPASQVESATAGNLPAASRVQAGQFVVPLLEDGRTEAFLLAEVTLEIASEEAARRTADTAFLRDLILREFFEAAATGAVSSGKADPARLEAALLRALNAELGPQTVSRVFFDRLLLQDNVQR